MKRTGPPARRTPLRSARRPPPVPVRRDWSDALAKVQAERVCRLGAGLLATGAPDPCEGRVEAAHVIGRGPADEPHPDGSGRLVVRGIDVVPLCARHHRDYDAHRLNLLPYLTPDEQTRAVQVAGGIVSAMQRTTGLRWAPVAPRTATPEDP